MSSDFMVACLCPSARSRPARAGDLQPRRAARRGTHGGHRRRARRSGAQAPRAGPSARSRDRPAPQEALRRATLLSGAGEPDCARQRRRRSWLPSSPTRGLDEVSRSGASRLRDCRVKARSRHALPTRDAQEFGPLGQASQGFDDRLRLSILTQGVGAPFAPSSGPSDGRAAKGEGRPVRRRASCGRARAWRRSPCGRRPSPSGRESRDGACAPACWVDRSASRLISESVARLTIAARQQSPRAKSNPPQRPFSQAEKLEIEYGACRFKARLMPREPREVNRGAPDRGLLRGRLSAEG